MRVDTGVDDFVIMEQLFVNDSFTIPPDTQHHLLGMKVTFDLRPRFLPWSKPLALSTIIDEEHELLISDNKSI
jgi:hypothetical protein